MYFIFILYIVQSWWSPWSPQWGKEQKKKDEKKISRVTANRFFYCEKTESCVSVSVWTRKTKCIECCVVYITNQIHFGVATGILIFSSCIPWSCIVVDHHGERTARGTQPLLFLFPKNFVISVTIKKIEANLKIVLRAQVAFFKKRNSNRLVDVCCFYFVHRQGYHGHHNEKKRNYFQKNGFGISAAMKKKWKNLKVCVTCPSPLFF